VAKALRPADILQLIKWILEALKPNWPGLVEHMKKLPKKEQPTDIIVLIDEMAEMSEAFFQIGRGAMQDYAGFLAQKSTSNLGQVCAGFRGKVEQPGG
jgi:hypothetical protein